MLICGDLALRIRDGHAQSFQLPRLLGTSEVHVLDWRVKPAVMERLHDDAREEARRFMEEWDFEEYKRRFRS
jgi:hypothetical protein